MSNGVENARRRGVGTLIDVLTEVMNRPDPGGMLLPAATNLTTAMIELRSLDGGPNILQVLIAGCLNNDLRETGWLYQVQDEDGELARKYFNPEEVKTIAELAGIPPID